MQKVNFSALFKQQSWSFCKKVELPEPFTDYFDQNIGRFLSSNYTLILYKSRETESGIFEKKMVRDRSH